MKNYKVIGLMSGTSLDGLDLVSCNFTEKDGRWRFEVEQAETLTYDSHWKKILTEASELEKNRLKELDVSYGKYLAESVATFIKKYELIPDFVASHGHTIFHQPSKAYTLQIGNGEVMAKSLNLPVVFDFRSLDVSMGGQGAPLVPIGDKLLFGKFDFCLNLGGFANISYEQNDIRVAFDICPVNMALNTVSNRLGLNFDENGALASKGKLNHQLFAELNKKSYYQLKAPKSLSREWFETELQVLLKNSEVSIKDLLHTLSEHIAYQISESLKVKNEGNVLITGGGAHNTHLINRIKENSEIEVIIPNEIIIDFKEAIIFALLGVLRMRNEINCLSSVTGATSDNSGGQIAYP